MKVAGFFSGVGGIELGFKQAGFEIIYANEQNEKAAKTYQYNFDLSVDIRDIRDVKASEIPDFDILVGGFPCQAFSVAGKRQGFDDEKGRGNLFFELERIFKEKKPSVIFLENVKNLVGHDNGNTFRIILEHLKNAGYYIKYQVLNAMQYGNLPQNRERIYIVAFKDILKFEKFNFPEPIMLTKKISDIIDFSEKTEEKYYYTPEKFKQYDLLKETMTDPKTLYQWRRKYVRANKSNVCPTLTANMGTGGHNVPLAITKYGFRKLTPKECFLFQGFPKNYKLPNIANGHLYKQAGNSVSVSVIKRIADNIISLYK